MKIGLFIPCYINQFYPKVAIATLEILEQQNLDIAFPTMQTCCGQPMANAGFAHLTSRASESFFAEFADFDYVVCPSGSCTLHLKEHLHNQDNDLLSRTFELTEFLTDILKIESLSSRFPYKVALHQSCHGQRGLKLSQMSELVAEPFSKPEHLLRMVSGIQLVELTRVDECCGFGGTFSVAEEAVSVRMGEDRIEDFAAHDVEYITSADMSCLMHLDGILRRRNRNIQTIHIAEILNAK